MPASLADIREELGKRTCDNLRDLAKSLNVRGYSKLTKDELVVQLLLLGEDRLRTTLFPTWWARHNTHVYGAASIAGLIVTVVGFPSFFPSNNASTSGVEKAIADLNLPKAHFEEKGPAVPVIVPPPFDFPSPEIAGVKPLTDDQRSSESFADAKVLIRNETSKNLKLAFAYRPYRERNPQIGASPYVQRESLEVPAGVTLEQRENNFGGPVHVSIFADQKWTSTNEWFDLRVVPRRTVVVTEKGGTFNCRVEFEEETP